MTLIVETVVTTLDDQGEPHFAAMGVAWGEETIVIRPYANTRTLRHLRARGQAVVNVTDDVLLFAKSALTHERLPCEPAPRVHGVILRDACHWREVEVREIAMPATRVARADVVTRVVGTGTRRPFVGLCRAKHAVVEASILASRLRFLPLPEIFGELGRLETLVEKTGGPREWEALRFIQSYVGRQAGAPGPA